MRPRRCWRVVSVVQGIERCFWFLRQRRRPRQKRRRRQRQKRRRRRRRQKLRQKLRRWQWRWCLCGRLCCCCCCCCCFCCCCCCCCCCAEVPPAQIAPRLSLPALGPRELDRAHDQPTLPFPHRRNPKRVARGPPRAAA